MPKCRNCNNDCRHVFCDTCSDAIIEKARAKAEIPRVPKKQRLGKKWPTKAPDQKLPPRKKKWKKWRSKTFAVATETFPERGKRRDFEFATDSFSDLREYLAEEQTTYQDYLRSGHWKKVRRMFLDSEHYEGKCESCNWTIKDKWHLHHKTYAFIGEEHEHLDSLAALCPACHSWGHEKHN